MKSNRWYVWKWLRGEKGVEYVVTDAHRKAVIARRRTQKEADDIADALNICLG